jgi:hypothetical protein
MINLDVIRDLRMVESRNVNQIEKKELSHWPESTYWIYLLVTIFAFLDYILAERWFVEIVNLRTFSDEIRVDVVIRRTKSMISRHSLVRKSERSTTNKKTVFERIIRFHLKTQSRIGTNVITSFLGWNLEDPSIHNIITFRRYRCEWEDFEMINWLQLFWMLQLDLKWNWRRSFRWMRNGGWRFDDQWKGTGNFPEFAWCTTILRIWTLIRLQFYHFRIVSAQSRSSRFSFRLVWHFLGQNREQNIQSMNQSNIRVIFEASSELCEIS